MVWAATILMVSGTPALKAADMTLVALGSHALIAHGFPRVPKDLDLVGELREVQSFARKYGSGRPTITAHPISHGKKLLYVYGPRKVITNLLDSQSSIVEAEIAWPNTTAKELLDMVVDGPTIQIGDEKVNVPSINILYAIKMSHRFLKNSPYFSKTMADIHLLRQAGAVITDDLKPFVKRREKETYTYTHPKLNVDKQSFFGEKNLYTYEHDTIHLSVMRGIKPAYELFKSNQAEVMCSKDLFFAQPRQTQLNAVLEESLVLALERSQIPFRGRVEALRSFEMALEKTCTSITSGWFRSFAWENYHAVHAMYDPNYVDKFWADVASGLVKKL